MQIDKNVPVPTEINYTKTAREIINTLSPGDSVIFNKTDGEKVRRALYTTLFRNKIKDKQFITKWDRGNGGLRIWRKL
jgi:hypothetical protein